MDTSQCVKCLNLQSWDDFVTSVRAWSKVWWVQKLKQKPPSCNITYVLIFFCNTGIFWSAAHPFAIRLDENRSGINVKEGYFWSSSSSPCSDQSPLCPWNATSLFSLFILISFSLSIQESLTSSSLTVLVSAFPLFSVFAHTQIHTHIQVEGLELQAWSAACFWPDLGSLALT